MTPRLAAVWFRRDLRVLDHGPLLAAARQGPVVCVYCVDPRELGVSREAGLPRLGAHRARFLLESLADLRDGLRRLGGELLVRRGGPEHVLPALARQLGWSQLLFHRLVGTEEEQVERAVEAAMAAVGCQVVTCWDRTLVPLDALPFAVSATPEVFTSFRERVEALAGAVPPLPAVPSLVAAHPEVDPGPLPTLAEFGLDEPTPDPRAVLPFRGGATAGRARLQAWLWDQDRLRHYKQTRNGMIGADYSSKFSPWLALGCLSARQVQAEIGRYEAERVRNESTYWLTFELLWRDYFQLIARKHGARLFAASGLRGIAVPWRRDRAAFERWCTGRTGIPLVDANLRELLATGFLSNRGRQIVASFLTKNLGLDWRWGAEWFESRLIDHDVAANHGNWCYAAGVGNDARGFRYFDIAVQAAKYDRDGDYVKLWCPELAPLGNDVVHAPWTVPLGTRQRLGVDYPDPIVDLAASVAANRRAWEAAVGR
ncbi:MAG: DASH family cryptochrome [Planctomycetes bacterium]|jgi:deoxyribodipyrimidine photo-lyase|nr:DASH family cryptochrome [Planctomycetota bacterium]